MMLPPPVLTEICAMVKIASRQDASTGLKIYKHWLSSGEFIQSSLASRKPPIKMVPFFHRHVSVRSSEAYDFSYGQQCLIRYTESSNALPFGP